MKLQAPFSISPSLLPGLKIGNGWIECTGPMAFRFLLEGKEIPIEGFEGYGPGSCASMRRGFSNILAFLSAWVEADSDTLGLFPIENKALRDWALENAELIATTQFDIESSKKDLII